MIKINYFDERKLLVRREIEKKSPMSQKLTVSTKRKNK